MGERLSSAESEREGLRAELEGLRAEHVAVSDEGRGLAQRVKEKERELRDLKVTMGTGKESDLCCPGLMITGLDIIL